MSSRTRSPRRRPQVVDATYLGFGLRISERLVVVSLNGRRLDSLKSMGTARRFCRGYRNAERKETQA